MEFYSEKKNGVMWEREYFPRRPEWAQQFEVGMVWIGGRSCERWKDEFVWKIAQFISTGIFLRPSTNFLCRLWRGEENSPNFMTDTNNAEEEVKR